MENDAKGEHIFLEGAMKIGGDCEVETARLNGAVTIGGQLNADRIAINLHGKSSIKEIGGEMITVKRENHVILHLDKWIKPLSRELNTELIEGDVLELEYTKANVVRGNTVIIGPGCEIGVVEYNKELRVSKEAAVSKSEKLQ